MTEFTTVDQPREGARQRARRLLVAEKAPGLKQVDRAKAKRAAAPTGPKPPRTRSKKATAKKAKPVRWILRRPSGDVPIADHARNEGMSPRDARVSLRAAFGKRPSRDPR
jgi:hypothetical protein